MKRAIAVLGLCILSACSRAPEPTVDLTIEPQLAREIAQIKAIDHHAHPVRPTAAGEAPDTDYDALPVESLAPQSDPIRMRANSPIIVEAHRLFSGKRPDPVALLDQLGIERMFANRVTMGPGLPSPRFLWVPFDDALMYPLSNASLIHNSDRQAFFEDEEHLLKRYYADVHFAARPATLDGYLLQVVRPTLERQKAGGAVAIKFEMAYLRAFDIGNPSRAEAEQAWRSGASRKALQNYIFRFIATEAGRLGMPVHFHTGAGSGGYFDVAGANPMLLEPLFDDPALKKTNFVLVHGGWPFWTQVTALLTKPNVYVDFSSQTLNHAPREVASILREWLEYVPEKVFFGTDAYPYSRELGFAESAYIATTSGREALGRALTQMLRDHEISHDRAVELARMVLRDNVRKLYGLP
jgi:predicted TIM-barrel fold metal-dependent hydrolase